MVDKVVYRIEWVVLALECLLDAGLRDGQAYFARRLT